MEKHFPIPKLQYALPSCLDRVRRDMSKKGETFVVCIYGYSQLAKRMIDSLREDKSLKVHLVTKSIIEMLRAEVDGITTIELKEIIT